MSNLHISPPLTAAADLSHALRSQGFAVISPHSVCQLAGVGAAQLAQMALSWGDLPPDAHLKDGGRYRRRRHASMWAQAGGPVQLAPHRAHWQPLSYNALHGGMQRWFEPMSSAVLHSPAWQQLVQMLVAVADAAAQPAQLGAGAPQRWCIEGHQFRIDTTDGIGRPTPEGAHRDGVDWVAVFLVQRHGIKGGETRVFDIAGPQGQRFTLTEPWTLLLLDDRRMVHETTPIQPELPGGWRDTLVLTLRADGFLDAPPQGAGHTGREA